MSPAWSRGTRKALRSLLQLIAAGGLTAAINQFADGLGPDAKVYVLAGWTVVIALAQNALETRGTIPVLLPTPGIVPAPGKIIPPVVGTVDAVAEKVGHAVGEVTGIVEGVTGEVLGEVVDIDKGES